MKLAEVLAKVANGESLTDEEKRFVAEYDEQKILDTAAANARKKAEKEARDAKDALEALKGEFDEYKAANDPAKKQTELDKALNRIAKLEKENADAKAKVAAQERSAKLRSLAKEAGINPAKGVSSESLDLLVDSLMAKIDLDDADAVKTAFDSFKTANAGLIDAGTVGGAGQKGNPGDRSYSGKNPFAKESFNLTEQLRLRIENPETASALEAAAQGK